MLSACQKREDEKNRLLINYEMAATIVPLLLIGTMIGVLLSKILPPVAITGCLCLYLIYSTYKMCTKAMETTRKENAKRKAIADLEASPKAPLGEYAKNDSSAKKEFLSEERGGGEAQPESNQDLVTADNTQVNVFKDTDVDVLDRGLYDAKETTCCQHFKKQLPNLGLLILSFVIV